MCAAQGDMMAPVAELLEEARRLDPSSTEGRFRLGEIVEALHRQLPTAVDNLYDRLAIDLEVDRNTITEAWFVAAAFAHHPLVRPAVDRLPDPTVPSPASRAGRPRRIGGLGSGADPAGAVGSLCRPPPQPAGPIRISWVGRLAGAVQERIQPVSRGSCCRPWRTDVTTKRSRCRN
jgi:hypothetical protein